MHLPLSIDPKWHYSAIRHTDRQAPTLIGNKLQTIISFQLCLLHPVSWAWDVHKFWKFASTPSLFSNNKNKRINIKNKFQRREGHFYIVKYWSCRERENARLLLHGYTFWLAACSFLYASYQIHDSTNHSLCYTNHGKLVGTRNSSLGPHEESIWWTIAPWARSHS